MTRYIVSHFFLLIVFTSVICTNSYGRIHDGPDPIGHWTFDSKHIKDNIVQARLGPNGKLVSKPQFAKDPLGESLRFDRRGQECFLAENFQTILEHLPEESMTVSAWVAIDRVTRWGGIMCVMQDNGSAETGWVLGYNDQNQFTFAISTAGAEDGDGRLTYIASDSKFDLGKLYHVVAVYDGRLMQLFVNGKLASSSKDQSGKIRYPKSTPAVIGAYHDSNEVYKLNGRIREISLYDIAAKPKWVKEEFEHRQDLAKLPKLIRDNPTSFIVKPYLQYGTRDSMTIMWRAAKPGPGVVHWGENARCKNSIESTKETEIQEVKITGLKPETQYFYWVDSVDANGNTIESDVSTFQTAAKPDTPFAFAVISDTQHNPKVSGPIAELAWAQRPNFLLHAGDLVDQGRMSDDWIDEFFASMHPLISRVPMFPVLGNHEQNAKAYYQYMSLPDPEYYYQFSYGNADFFMIDSNKKVDSDSEQFKWLDKALADSQATWKFVSHHHPPYSSDENDYGNLWKTNKSSRGDTRMRALIPLYDKYGVDIVWTGHIHSYERTWPLRENKAVDVNGTIYMITGGGGGSLETPGPYRPFFQNNVRRGHHYVMVAINGRKLEFKAFSLDDKMFDSMTISK